jgi:hypothetical protein
VLLAVGLPAKPANVADAVAFVASLPGSALGSRPELQGQGGRVMRLAPLSIAGSVGGAALLLLTPAGVFARIVPFLVTFAALALLAQPRVSSWLDGHPGSRGGFWPRCGLLAVWLFDGYWGVGAGVLALRCWRWPSSRTWRGLTPLRTCCWASPILPARSSSSPAGLSAGPQACRWASASWPEAEWAPR